MELQDLKEGDKLYNLSYYSSSNFGIKAKRGMDVVTVKKANKRYATLKGGYSWNVTAKEFNNKWFPSKKGCYEKALRLHIIQAEELKKDLKVINKEIKYLKKKIGEEE